MALMLDGIELWLRHPIVQQLGWVLVHFVWQGALVAGVLAAVLALLRAERARLRYALSLAALVVLLALPVTTWVVLPGPAAPAGAGTGEAPLALSADAMALALASAEASAPTWAETARAALTDALPWLVAGWLGGVWLLALRLLGGWMYTLRLRQRHARPVSDAWQRRADVLAVQFGMSRTVRVRQSARIDVPMVIGWLRPVVLVPVSVFTGLPPEQVEALLAHELAHIRRHDVLVGRLQAVAETLLFYHPAVWWVSRQLCIEREHCCDDRVVQAFHDRVTYARALTTLAARPVHPPAGALAATDGALLARIRRLVGASPATEARSTRSSVSIALLVVAVGLALTGMQLGAPAASEGRAHRAALMPWMLDGTASADTTERIRVVRRTRTDTLEREGAPASPPDVFLFRSDSLGEFSFAPGPLDSLDRQVDVFVQRHLSRLDTIPMPPLPDAPVLFHLDSLPAVHAPFPPDFSVSPDTIDLRMLRARLDSLRREIHRELREHREDLHELTREQREEAPRLRREHRERMREEHPERLREQAESLRRRAERLEEEAQRLEQQRDEEPEPEDDEDRS